MSSQRYKYPRTPHLSFSPGVGGDDIKLDSNKSIVRTVAPRHASKGRSYLAGNTLYQLAF